MVALRETPPRRLQSRAVATQQQLRQQLFAQRHAVQAGLSVGQRGVRVVAGLVIVVLHVQTRQFGVFDAERTARVVDVLPV